MFRALVTVIFLFYSFFALAQNEAAIWYFGQNAGLDFNSGTPVALTDGALNTVEGCATISDATGNLLFYTDGITVWNRNHTPMPNGTGLMGHPSSTQSGIIVPWPGNPDNYYVFTVHDAGEPEGLRYSVVDMTLDGGLGDVTTKNIPLATPVTEKLTAVEHANGTDIWVLAHGYGSNEFLAYLVTPTGLVTTPVVSAVGEIIEIQYNGQGSRGYMKVSPNGEYIVTISLGANLGEVFQFNTSNGQVSNPIPLTDYFPPPPYRAGHYTYGAEFSSDSSKLYISHITFYVSYTFEADIFQFDLSNYDQASIFASGNQVSYTRPGEIGALQLALDGKIYFTQILEEHLGVINNPNLVGAACDVDYNAVPLSGRIGLSGLPPFIQSYFVVGLQARNFCLGDATEFEVTSSDPITGITWDFGDGNSSSLENPTHIYTAPGNYSVNVTVTTATDTKTESKEITIYDVPSAYSALDIEVCHTEDTYAFDVATKNSEILGAQNPNDFEVSYFTSPQDRANHSNAINTTFYFPVGTNTIYAKVASNDNQSCFTTTEFDILVKRIPDLLAVPDSTICDNNGDGVHNFDLSDWDELIAPAMTNANVSYHASQADADAKFNPLPTNFTNTNPTETIYFRIENATFPECYRVGQFQLEVIGQVIANTPNDLEYCDYNNDGHAIFDLTQAESEIIGAQNASSINITYHESQADADSNTNALSASNYLSTSYQNTIYVRVENVSDTTCYDTTSFDLNIFDTPVAPMVNDWQVCDDNNDGQYLFDLTEKANGILSMVSGVSVSFYESQANAELAQNAIGWNYQNTSSPQMLYFRLDNIDNANCYDVGTFQLHVFDMPAANTPLDIVVCDIDDTGSYAFDLSQKDGEVLNGQDALGYEVSYHTSELEALNNENPLSKTNYENSGLTETIWARVQHNQLDFCYDVTSFNLIINPLPQPNLEKTYVICPDRPNLTIDGGTFETYEWRNSSDQFVGNDQFLPISELGTYALTVTETNNGITCENSVTFEVVSSGAPDSFTVETSGISDVITLTVDAIGVGDFEYSVDGINFQTGNTFEVFPGAYTMYVRDPFECRLLTQDIIAMGYPKFFSPNGDGTNEYWNIIGGDLYPNSQVYIYDRYGKLLQQISPMGQGWDGTYFGQQMPASDYWFRYEYDNGKVLTGHFALKR